MKRLYTVKEAACEVGMSEEDIVDLVRLDEITDRSFSFTFTLEDGTVLRGKDCMRIASDDIESIPTRCDARYDFKYLSYALLHCSGPEDFDVETEIAINDLIRVWLGALFDDPDDREAETVVLLLEAMRENFQLRRRRREEWGEQAKVSTAE